MIISLAEYRLAVRQVRGGRVGLGHSAVATVGHLGCSNGEGRPVAGTSWPSRSLHHSANINLYQILLLESQERNRELVYKATALWSAVACISLSVICSKGRLCYF